MKEEELKEKWLELKYSENASGAQLDELRQHEKFTHIEAESKELDEWLSLEEDAPLRPGFDTRFYALLKQEQEGGKQTHWLELLQRWFLPTGLVAAGLIVAFVALNPGDSENNLSNEDMEVAMEMEMYEEELSLLQQMEDIEAYEVLAAADIADFDAVETN